MSEADPQLHSHKNWVIGIGASAGGLEALTSFISKLPTDSLHCPIIVAQHLAPKAKSMMVELLQRQSARPVKAAEDGETLKADTIYVVPPNFDIDLIGGKVKLTRAGEETRPKPSIDEFFGSLASAYGSRAVGIILSGTGSDGSAGIQAIKAVGGVTLAQDDHSAKYDGMPRSAVNTGDIDTVLSPESMAADLTRILGEHEIRLTTHSIHDAGLAQVLKVVEEKQGTEFSRYKMSTLQRRVAKRMNTLDEKGFDSYLERIKNSPAELQQLSQELLVSVTSFFRDPEVFRSLEPLIEKIVSSKHDGEEIRIWVAGCATGEEAYTVAMQFHEIVDEHRKHLRLKVFATDLDQDALLEARLGVYSAKECEKIPPRMLEKFFNPSGDGFEISKKLRETVVFARQDLTASPPFTKMDLITCRNVLIYFNAELQKKIIEIFHYSLNQNGILLLGKSESVAVVSTLFDTINRVSKIYSKLNVPSRPQLLDGHRKSQGQVIYRPARQATGPSIAERSYLRLLKSFDVSGVTVDADCNILQMIGDVSPFLGFFTPQADFRLTNLLPKGIGIEIPILIRKAAQDGKAHRSRSYKLTKSDRFDSFSLCVRPLIDDEELVDRNDRQLFVISFDGKNKKKVKSEGPEVPSVTDSATAERINELEQELFVTREHLQTVIEELGVSNEELQSLNEELSSTNEELQASSEELETTNEELQSSNEELTTVNEELNAKQAELRTLTVSFENVQNSIGTPMVILDNRRRIVRHNPEALKVFTLSSGDHGKDIGRVSSHFETEDFIQKIDHAIQHGKTSETLVDVGPVTYQMRILPCMDDRNDITGAILVFMDQTQILRTQDRLRDNEGRLRSIIDGSTNLIFLKDTFGRYISVNRAFCEFFDIQEQDALGKTDRELFPEEIAIQFREADLEVFVNRERKERQEFIQMGTTRHAFLISRFPLFESNKQIPYAVGAVGVNITQQIDAQNDLATSENRYRTIVEDRFVFVCRHKPDGSLTYTNLSFNNQFGGTFEKKLGQKFEKIVAEVDRPKVTNEISTISAENPIVQYEHRMSGSGPKVEWIRWIHRGIFDAHGNITEYQAVGFDITESRLKQDQLIERDAVFSSVFEHTIDFLSIYRVEEGEFVLESFNRSAAKVMGSAYAQMLGRSLKDLYDKDRYPETVERYNRVVRNKTAEVFEEQIETPTGLKHFTTTIIPIPGINDQVERIAAISRDSSLQKRIEIDLRRAKEEAEVANKSKSDFLASMSHELRTPLNVVLGMSQLLQDTELNKEQSSFLGSIYRSGKVLLTLIEDVLDVSKIEAGKVKLDAITFNPAEIVDEVMDMFLSQARDKKIQLIADISPKSDKFVIGDPARLRQVFVNLVNNAIKFTDKGSVKIEILASLDASEETMNYYCSVTDTGIGIPEEAHKRLFQRFSQIDSGNARKYGGTGLGLMISKHLVNMMGGEIGVESKPGVGSKFWYRIPFPISKHQGAYANVHRETVPTSTANLRPLKILAVDDSDDSRAVIGLFLQKLGHDTTLASGGFDALRKIKDTDYDLVLMDIQMPDMDGYQATAQIRGLKNGKSKTPVIALTANAMSGDASKAFEAGMDDYITKPIQITALKALLTKWAQRV